MIDLPLIWTILRELTTARGFERVPETHLVMDDTDSAATFARAGETNGILSGVYTYHLAQSCAVIRPGDTVLDLGCGPANLLAATARLEPDAQFIGVDLSRAMVDEGQKLLAAGGIGNVELRIDDITNLNSVEDGSIDVVLSSMALHHLPDTSSLESCLSAIDRALAPGGKVYLCDFGRLKSIAAVDYFVARAIPASEPLLGRDYYESLKAAFSRAEIEWALSKVSRRKLRLHSTPVSPLMIVIRTDDGATLAEPARGAIATMIRELPRRRRQDFDQLRMFLRLGGLKWVI